MPAVEQIKLKRAGTGLRACDPDRARPGFTLFAPLTGGGIVYLVDLEGRSCNPTNNCSKDQRRLALTLDQLSLRLEIQVLAIE